MAADTAKVVAQFANCSSCSVNAALEGWRDIGAAAAAAAAADKVAHRVSNCSLDDSGLR